MRIGSGNPGNAHAANAPEAADKAAAAEATSLDEASDTPARTGALAELRVRRTVSTNAPPQPRGDTKGKRLLPSSAEAAVPASTKRLRPASALPAAATSRNEPLDVPAGVPTGTTREPTQTLGVLAKGSRRNTTADMVYRMLLARSRGGSTSVIARDVLAPDGTVGRWINAKRWQSGELQVALSKMPDYAQRRDAIDALAKTMHLTSEDLPSPPAKQRVQVSAALLKAALESMLAKQDEQLVGRGRTPGMLSAVAGPLGLERRTLGAWLNADGTPAKPLDAFARLPDYAQVRGDLQLLFSRLGHQEVADSLHVPGDSGTHKMSTALLVDILRKIEGERASSSGTIGAALGVQPSLVRKYVSLEQSSLRELDLIRNMPDYAQHRESLAASLAALGHTQQARDLPLPWVDAERLLNALRSEMPRFIDAMNTLQRNPALSPREAAVQANLLPEALTAVIGAGGVLRQRGDVHDTLSRFGSHLVPGIDEALARLHAVASGKIDVAAAPREMARFELPARGSIPGKVFIVRPSTGDPGPKAKNRLEKIYANNEDLVRLPRSYGTERPRQMLRWLSTVLKNRFPAAREVQCYFHVGTRQIVVASNTNEANADLARFFDERGAGDLAAYAQASLDAREKRHAGKLGHALASAPNRLVEQGRGTLEEQVRAAIAAGRFHVPRERFSERGSTVSLHAERRILHYVRETFDESMDRRLLAGTMRPCGSCADELGFDDKARRGPFWLSRPAQAFVDTPRIIERNIADGVGTYVTKTREGRVTTDYDTDSDSDVDERKAAMARGRR
ncbi:MAG TPA: hypothetical protein VL635_14500 [Trinickia sp.]|nr:hypothetical protein [Trinickia sp.]